MNRLCLKKNVLNKKCALEDRVFQTEIRADFLERIVRAHFGFYCSKKKRSKVNLWLKWILRVMRYYLFFRRLWWFYAVKLCVKFFRNIHRTDLFFKIRKIVDTFMNIMKKPNIRMGVNEGRRGRGGPIALRKKKWLAALKQYTWGTLCNLYDSYFVICAVRVT